MSKVSVVIVTYQSAETISDCLASLPAEVETIVVDNGSTDGTPEIVERFPKVRLIRSHNTGFGAGCNLGASYARGEILLFLNPDASLSGESLALLASCLKANPKAGAVGPRIIAPEGNLELSWGKTPSILSEFQRKREHLNPPSMPPQLTSVDWVSGACLALPMEAWREVEGFDEGFFLYFEDVDLCHRLAASGWRILFEPQAVASHVRGHSAQKISRQTEVWYRQSQRRFYKKHSPPLQRFLLSGYLALKYAPKALLGDTAAKQILVKQPK